MARPKESERQDIRTLVLEKAKKLFFDIGYGNITMRKIAEEVGCSPAAIYLYFRNKEEILYELHNEGFKLLYQYKLNMADRASTALERLWEGGKMYITFALENPEYYEVMFNMPEPRDFLETLKKSATRSRELPVDYAMRSYGFLKESILVCQENGYLQEIDPDVATFMFWSLGHGLVSLIIRKRVPSPQAPSQELAEAAIDYFMELIIAKAKRHDVEK
jgi:AcrR family transcriptional regulator